MGSIESLLEVCTLKEFPGIQDYLMIDALLFSIVIQGDISKYSERKLLDSVLEFSKFEDLRFIFKNRVEAFNSSFAQ